MAADPGRLARVHIHLDHGRNPRPPLTPDAPSEDPGGVYGYQWAEQLCDLRFSTSHSEGRATRLARRGLKYLLGFDLVHAFRNRRELASADVLWTHTEHEHLAVSLLMRLGVLPRRPMIAQSVWLWDLWPRISPARRALIRWLHLPECAPTTLSPVNAAVAGAALERQALCLPFGTGRNPALRAPGATPEAAPVSGPPPVRVVAPGSDRDRDWELLRRVFDRTPGLEVLVLSRRRSARRAFRGARAGAAVRFATSRREVVEAYDSADVVAVPLRPNTHASGISAAFESLLQGRPTVVSDTGGVSDYFGSCVRYAPPGDASAFADAVLDAARGPSPSADEAAAAVAARGLRDRDYAHRHLWLTHHLLGVELTDQQLEAVSAFASVPPAPPVEAPPAGGR